MGLDTRARGVSPASSAAVRTCSSAARRRATEVTTPRAEAHSRPTSNCGFDEEDDLAPRPYLGARAGGDERETRDEAEVGDEE